MTGRKAARSTNDGAEAHPGSVHDTEDEMAACQVCQSGREYDCGHACCDERHDPLHDHFLRPVDCPSCKTAPANGHSPRPADNGDSR